MSCRCTICRQRDYSVGVQSVGKETTDSVGVQSVVWVYNLSTKRL